MNFKLALFLTITATALIVPANVNAQIASKCSSLRNIYVLARGVYDFPVSGSCVNVDGKHSPYLTKAAFQQLRTKPKVNVFY